MALSLKSKITLLALAISLVFLALFIFLSTAISKNKLTQASYESMQQLSISTARGIEEFFQGSIREAAVLAQNQILINGKRSDILHYFNEIIELAPSFSNIALLELDGSSFCDLAGLRRKNSAVNDNYPELTALFNQAMDGDQEDVFISEPVITVNGPSLILFVPVTNRTNTIVERILKVELSLESLRKRVDNLAYSVMDPLSIYLMDHTGKIIATKDPLLESFSVVKDYQALLFQLKRQNNSVNEEYYLGQKKPMLATYIDLQSFGTNHALNWSIVSVVPKSKVLQPIEDLQRRFLKLGVLITLMAVLVAHFLAKHITMPLCALTKFANEVSLSGNFSHKIKINTRDETEIVATAINDMLAKIEKQNIQLQQAKETAELSNNSKTAFFTNMSHELRTPLHGIISYADLGLKRVEKSDISRKRIRRYFHNIDRSAERLLLLLNDLLDLAKLEAGKMNMDVMYASLRKVAVDVVTEQQARLDEKNLQLIWGEERCTTFTVFDPARIAQVIANLLSNAIKFTPAGGAIHINFQQINEKSKPMLQFQISDTGKGIPKDELEQIFDQFAQSSNNELVIGSSGLGLAICKEIIQSHQGQIWAQNGASGGAVFRFNLPLENLS